MSSDPRRLGPACPPTTSSAALASVHHGSSMLPATLRPTCGMAPLRCSAAKSSGLRECLPRPKGVVLSHTRATAQDDGMVCCSLGTDRRGAAPEVQLVRKLAIVESAVVVLIRRIEDHLGLLRCDSTAARLYHGRQGERREGEGGERERERESEREGERRREREREGESGRGASACARARLSAGSGWLGSGR
jgi:hypothetical protein